jgi:uncharacterized protein YaaQ
VATPEPTFFFFTPMEVEVGGAVVFGVPVERFVKLPTKDHVAGDVSTQSVTSRTADEPPTQQSAQQSTEGSLAQIMDDATKTESGHMKLIVAIVQGEDADDVIRAMLAAGHRLTRINTTGGFLRRGNATLLIGVEEHQIDEVIGLMQATTRRRTESAPLEKGIPEYAATVFVLDSSHFIRI